MLPRPADHGTGEVGGVSGHHNDPGGGESRKPPEPEATGGDTVDTTAAAAPSTVAGATAGATTMFAGIDARLACVATTTTTGTQATCAARNRERLTTGRGTHGMASRHAGASRRMPAVASTDSANPASVPSQGSRSSSTRTAARGARHAGARTREADKRDGSHDRRPDNAGLGAGEQDEAGHSRHPECGQTVPRTPTHRARPRTATRTTVRWCRTRR